LPLANTPLWQLKQLAVTPTCEVDASLEDGDELYQFLFDRLQAPGERALQLLGRDFGLVEGLRVDQVADGFRLREVDASVEEGPHGEFAGLGQACAGSDAEFDDMPQDYR